jgi:glucose/arabinose dehydrogenase
MSHLRRVMGPAAIAALLSALVVPLHSQPTVAAPVEPGFQEQIVFSGLERPTNIEFSSDGRVFVAEQRGVVKVFDSLADDSATVFADLRTVVHDVWDRGLLGLALHPDFPDEPWVYVLYTYDAPPGQAAPYWNDNCSTVSGGANGGRCVVTARLSKLQAAGSQMTGSEQVLIRDWCQQYPSHSVGSLRFGADGALYASGGDGASFSTVDYGQLPSGGPINPCGDPPGGTMQPPTAEGGALRSQALNSSLSNPLDLDGTILRLNPDTGGPMPGNPLIGASDVNRQRAVAMGLRNPFRFTIRPGTNEVWAGDVGWGQWEEINRLQNPTAGPRNFGWPCYEGAGPMPSYQNANLNLCTLLYGGSGHGGGHTGPYYTYRHSNEVGTGCPTGGSSVTGLAFHPQSGGTYPTQFRGALFFADYSRQCIWAMKPSQAGGLPSPGNVSTFVTAASTPVDLEMGPGEELYWADLAGGTVRRIRYTPGNTPPTAVIQASPTVGAAPLTVEFDGTGSLDPDPADQDNLTYEWDFTDDGTVDATGPTAGFTYQAPETSTARLKVTDTLGASHSTTVTIRAGGDGPTAVIDTPDAGLTWAVGDDVTFSGSASDPDEGDLPASALRWQLRMQHCSTPTDCHVHSVQTWDGVASGTFIAPDHDYPSRLDLVLTATNSSGVSHTEVRQLQPKTVDLTMVSDPPGLELSLGAATRTTPFTQTVIQGSENTMSAPSPQTVGGSTYAFDSWTHGGTRTQVITAPSTATTYTAVFERQQPPSNLALNRPATASGQCNTSESPAKAVNGSWTGGNSDKWCTLTATKWWRVDLGGVHDVGSIVVRHSGAGGESAAWNTRDFNLQVSTDGATWNTVKQVAGNTDSVTVHDVSAVGRYVRLNVITPTSNGNPAARIYEVEVYGPRENLALNRPATASGQCTTSEGPAKAVNGSWTGGNSDKWCTLTATKWWRVDLGGVHDVRSIVVRHSGAGGESAAWNTRDFNLQVSTDGATWNTVAQVSGNTSSVTVHDVSAVGRYVRLNVITPTSNGNPAARIYEVEVYGAS